MFKNLIYGGIIVGAIVLGVIVDITETKKFNKWEEDLLKGLEDRKGTRKFNRWEELKKDLDGNGEKRDKDEDSRTK